MIELHDVTYAATLGTQRVEILRGVSLHLHRGEITALTGPSGSGKSTLLALIAGLDRPTSGTLRVNGIDYAPLDMEGLARVRRRHIGIVFQDFHLIPALTALENVALPLELSGDARAEGEARRLLEAVGLKSRLHHRPGELSGGEKQRVAIARAFSTQPAILLADEPTGNLDQDTSGPVMDLLLSLSREHGRTLLLVTHDATLAARASRRLHLRHGQLAGHGP